MKYRYIGEGYDPVNLAYYKLVIPNASSPSNRAHCYAGHLVSSTVVAKTIANIYIGHKLTQGGSKVKCVVWFQS